MFQPDQTAATCALWQGTAWRAGHFTFSAAPGGNAETDADQQCSSAAETTPGSRMMRMPKISKPAMPISSESADT
jgi:hypothetical protein